MMKIRRALSPCGGKCTSRQWGEQDGNKGGACKFCGGEHSSLSSRKLCERQMCSFPKMTKTQAVSHSTKEGRVLMPSGQPFIWSGKVITCKFVLGLEGNLYVLEWTDAWRFRRSWGAESSRENVSRVPLRPGLVRK